MARGKSHISLIEPPAHRKRPLTALGSGLGPPSLCRPRGGDARCLPAGPNSQVFKKPARSPRADPLGTARIPARAREDEACGGQPAPHRRRRASTREERGRPAAAENGSGFEDQSLIGWPHTSLKGLARTPLRSWAWGIRRGEGGRSTGTAARLTGNAPRIRAEGFGGPSRGYCGTASSASAEAEGAADAQEPEGRTETAEGGEAAA